MKRLVLSLLFSLLGAAAARDLSAQATATASRQGRLQVGAGVDIAKPDYGLNTIKGVAAWADLDLTYHVGVELIYHNISIVAPDDIGEDSYMIGPRYVLHYGRVEPYIKVLFGIGRFQRQPDYAPHSAASYGIYAGGGGADVRITRHFNVRGDFEAQRWPGFPNNGLTPYVGTVGVGYAF